MSGPWERYAKQPEAGPWTKYAATPAQEPRPDEQGVLADIAGGTMRGFNRVVGTLGKAVTSMLPDVPAYQKQRAQFDEFNKGLDDKAGDSTTYKVADVSGQVLATLPAGGVIAAPIKALAGAGVAPQVLGPIAEAIASGGMKAGGLSGPAGLAVRSAGGAVAGGAAAGLVNPDDAGAGAVVGAALPPIFAAGKKAGQAVGGVFKPWLASGQDEIAGKALRQFSTNPDALRNLQAAREVIPGSAPNAVMASGDEGLAGLSRTMQSVSPSYAAELSTQQAAQNAARTRAIEEIAGTPGKLAAAKEARDAATAAMRDEALAAAGNLPAAPIIKNIDSMLRNPNNAGRIAQQALRSVRDQIAGAAGEGGAIDARALYAIRKDINDVLSGKLQGEAGNLRYASGQLIDIKGMIDTLIDRAGRTAPATGTAVAPAGANLAAPGAAGAAAGPRSTWRTYLDEYTKQSVPINRMEALDDILKRIQTGTVDRDGNLILSAAKLNNILKNEGQDIRKALAPEQLDLIQRLAADLNASQLASNAGKAVGSNTVQNLASSGVLNGVVGGRVGGSTLARNTVGRIPGLLYRNADKEITEKIGAALLDPQEAARLMADPKTAAALDQFFARTGLPRLAYQAAPLLPAQ